MTQNNGVVITILTTCLALIIPTLISAAPIPTPAAPDIAARSYLIQDFNSGRIIAEKNAFESMEPASLTKLMTAYIVFSELKSGTINLDDQVLVSKKAWQMQGSKMFIEVNKRISVENLLKGMIIQSGNDASVALAEYVAGSEDAFVSLMNHYVQNLGMTGSNFVNSTGLPHRDHYSTANDLAILTRTIINDFPEYYKWYSIKKFTFNDITQSNRNKLLWRDKTVDGIKTGHTESAGYCLIASAQRDDMRLISVVLGTKSKEARAHLSQKMLNYGFRFYETRRLFSANSALTTTRIWKGNSEELPLGISEDLYITIPRGQYKNLNTVMNVDNSIIAPANKNQQFGTLEVSLDNDIVTQQPLIALRDIAEGGLLQRLIDDIKLMFQ